MPTQLMVTGPNQRGEGEQLREVLLTERNEVLHEDSFSRAEKVSLYQRPPILEQVMPPERDDAALLDLYAFQAQLLGLDAWRMAEDLALNHDDGLIGESNDAIQTLPAFPLLD
ncbi:MAG: hypothetical protein M3173_06775 [Chloroflexota bacterium]|nr:hypothetical protein [Chloroflexota bacterium]